jgi:Uma2 family endonuclease
MTTKVHDRPASSDYWRSPSFVWPLCNGDRLDQKEFHRRYSSMPRLKHAELINGVVFFEESVRGGHGGAHATLGGYIGKYAFSSPRLCGAINASLILDDRNELQPDICVTVDAQWGGRTRLIDGFLHGGPEFVAEIAENSANRELHDKMEVYGRHRVQEYVVWRVYEQEIDWFVLRDGSYVRQHAMDGVYRSIVLPGLWLHAQAMIEEDHPTLLSVQQQGLDSPEHRAFVERLAAHKNAPPSNAK